LRVEKKLGVWGEHWNLKFRIFKLQQAGFIGKILVIVWHEIKRMRKQIKTISKFSSRMWSMPL
jgi:hypothetical protein